METKNKTTITVETNVDAPVEKVWEYWTKAEHVTQWSHASDDWHTTYAENDFRPGGKFLSRMEAKDGSVGFDFSGVNDVIQMNEYIEYTMDDDRKVWITFTADGDTTHIKESFEAEETNSVEMQKGGWQAILNNFKKYAELTW